MNHHHCSSVESILAGTAEVVDGCISIVGDSGEELFLPVVEVLDEVHDILLTLHGLLRQYRHRLPPSTLSHCGGNVWSLSRLPVPLTERCLPDIPPRVTSSSNTNPLVLVVQMYGVVLWASLW